MSDATATLVMNGTTRPRRGRARPQDVDRFVGARMRQRRIMIGMTQQMMADRLGVTYQQAHKYEKGINRVAAGRLYFVAQVLGVDVSYFFDGLDTETSVEETPQQRTLLELARNFTGIPTRRQQDAVCSLVRALTGPIPEQPIVEQPSAA